MNEYDNLHGIGGNRMTGARDPDATANLLGKALRGSLRPCVTPELTNPLSREFHTR